MASRSGRWGVATLALSLLACFGTLPWTLARVPAPGTAWMEPADRPSAARYEQQNRTARHLPPAWWPVASDSSAASRRGTAADAAQQAAVADAARVPLDQTPPPQPGTNAKPPTYLLGTDVLGRDMLSRVLLGGCISLTVGLLAAAISVLLGTVYGAIAGYVGGWVDAVMMRIVDVLYGLPYVLLVVLLAVASNALVEQYASRSGARRDFIEQASQQLLAAENPQPVSAAEGTLASAAKRRMLLDEEFRKRVLALADARPDLSPRGVSAPQRMQLELATLLFAIGAVSWLTMARVVRGQVLSLKAQPFVEAARAVGASRTRIFVRHLLPNLVGPIIVYATLTVPQAILQESFLSFLGIGVKPPLPSWGNLAAEGLEQLNPVQSQWWLPLFPCLALAATLVALNLVGEALRETFDPKSRNRSAGRQDNAAAR